MHELTKIFAVLGVFFLPALVVVIIVILRHKQRMEMIRRGLDPDSNLPRYPGQGWLFKGVLLTGLGIALTLCWLFQMQDDGLRLIAFCCLGAGIALLVYWKLTAPDREQQKRYYEGWMAVKRKEWGEEKPVILPEDFPASEKTDDAD